MKFKRNSLLLLSALLLCSGCVQHYIVTLANRDTIKTIGKPKYDKATDTYKIKRTDGREDSVPAFRIREIAPE